MKILFYILPLFLILSYGCANDLISGGEVANASVAATAAYAAWEISPDDWTNSEKAATAAAVGGASYIVGKIMMNKSEKDELKAFQKGFAKGRAYGARRQFDIIEALQRDNSQYNRALYPIPAPIKPGIKTVPYNVYLEVTE